MAARPRRNTGVGRYAGKSPQLFAGGAGLALGAALTVEGIELGAPHMTEAVTAAGGIEVFRWFLNQALPASARTTLPDPARRYRPSALQRRHGMHAWFPDRREAEETIVDLLRASANRERPEGAEAPFICFCGVANDLLLGYDAHLKVDGIALREHVRERAQGGTTVRVLQLDPSSQARKDWAKLENRPDAAPAVVRLNIATFYDELGGRNGRHAALKLYDARPRAFIIITDGWLLVEPYIHGVAVAERARPCIGINGQVEVWRAGSNTYLAVLDEFERMWSAARKCPDALKEAA